MQAPSTRGTQSVIVGGGDLNDDGLGDLVVAVSVEPAQSTVDLATHGVYILFGRPDWSGTIDVVREADVVIDF